MYRVILLPHKHVLEEAALNQGFALTLKYQPQNCPDVNANDLFFCAIAIQSMQQAIGSDIKQFKLIEHVLQADKVWLFYLQCMKWSLKIMAGISTNCRMCKILTIRQGDCFNQVTLCICKFILYNKQ